MLELSQWIHNNLPLVGATVLILLLIIVSQAKRHQKRPQDPQRVFTNSQRQDGFARAGGRCEFPSWLPWLRCRRTASHADHYLPWSRGGASSMQNFVAACPQCNLRKGARLPSRFARHQIERRRRRYFPPGTPPAAGAWFGGQR